MDLDNDDEYGEGQVDENATSQEDSPEPKERKLSPRDLAILAMEAKVDHERGVQLAAEGVVAPQASAKAEKSNAGPSAPQDGDAEPKAQTAQDPTAEFIRVVDGKVMVVTKVNGKEQLQPITDVVAAAQRTNSADQKFQQAAALQRQVREEASQLAAQRTASANTTTRSTPDVDKAALLATSKDLVHSLIHDEPEVAAQRLADILANTQARGPVIDMDQLSNAAASKATKQLSQEQLVLDMRSGLAKFATEYPEIEADPKLRAAADSISDIVEAEHSNWSPSQIILEAGRRTREWVQSMTGETPTAEVPAAKTTTKQVSNRQARKEGLVPMPKGRTGRAETSQVEVEQTPQQILAEIRKSRQQAHAV